MHNRISITEDVIRINNYLEIQGSGVIDCQIFLSASALSDLCKYWCFYKINNLLCKKGNEALILIGGTIFLRD